LPFAKILTTGLTVGSGGSGGIFGPGMVIGGMLGATIWRLFYHVLPGIPDTPAPFVIVGMMALFGGIARAPLAVMLMVAEMTGNLSMLAPAMIAVGLSYLLVGRDTIYRSQLETRVDSPAHRLQFAFPLLATLSVRSAMTEVSVVLGETQTLAEAAALLALHDRHGAPVLDEKGTLRGVLTKSDIERVPEVERAERHVVEAMNREVLVIQADETLDEALEELTTSRVSWAPVGEEQTPDHSVIGVVSTASIMQLYRSTLAKNVRRTRGMVEGTTMQEVEVKPEMFLAGRALRDAELPPGCLVVSIRRGSTSHFPRGRTVILPGDTITLLMNPQGERQWQEYITRKTGVSAVPSGV
jgi:chloride channel protein, CIC family